MKIIILLILFLLLLIYYLKNIKENFSISPSNNGNYLNIMNPNDIDIPNNQNYNKIWKSKEVANENQYIQDIPINPYIKYSSVDNNNNSIPNDNKVGFLEKLIDYLNKNSNKINEKFVKLNNKNFEVKLLNSNYKTWKEGNNEYINSDNEIINILNKNFMKYLNENQRRFITKEKLISIGIQKYEIINYKIKNIYVKENSK